MTTRLSIIILTYNSENYIEKLLESITKFNKGSDYEIIIVDNDSKDRTIEAISKIQDPRSKIELIKNKENVGFARGINIGAKEARGGYLLFVNPDMEWKGGSIEDFVRVFESDEMIGVIGGRILTKVGNAEKSAGKFLKTLGVIATAVSLDEVLGFRLSPTVAREVDFVSGGFMAVRRDLFEKLSGFDENLFMYVEDMEFCFRVKKDGLKVVFDPSVEVIHESHGSSNRSFAIENIYRGLLYFHKKHGNAYSYNITKSLFKSKALTLVLLGKIINNKYLTDTYSKLLRL